MNTRPSIEYGRLPRFFYVPNKILVRLSEEGFGFLEAYWKPSEDVDRLPVRASTQSSVIIALSDPSKSVLSLQGMVAIGNVAA